MIKLFKYIPGNSEFGHFNKYTVSDGEPVNETITNAAFVSRTSDSNTTGKIDLDNADASSGDTVANIQRELNGQDSFVTDVTELENAHDRKPTWLSDTIGSANQAVKQRVESVQTQVETNTADILTKVTKVTSTDNAVTRFDGVSGDVQDSGVLIDDSGNVTIPGDLTVNGATTTIDTATLDVTDANITVNKGGNQATADSQDSGLTVEMSDATDASIGYNSALTSKWQAGEVGSEKEVVTVSDVQDVSNKTVVTTGLTFDEIATPSTPASGDNKLYFKSDNSLYRLDDAGNEVEVGAGTAGSGSGRINFLDTDESNFESGIGVWTTYDDTSVFVDGTGGSPTAITVSQETGSPLVGTGSLKIAKAASDASGEGASVLSLSIDPQYRGRTVIVEFEQDFTDANYTSQDAEIKAYDITNAEIMTIVGDTLITNSKGKKQVAISTKTNTAQIRLALHVASDSGTGVAWNAYLDAALLTIDNTAPAPIVTEWESFTPTINNFTLGNGTVNAFVRRVGSNKEYYIDATLGSTSAMGSDPTFVLQGSDTVDSNILDLATTTVVGEGQLLDSGVANLSGIAAVTSSTEIRLRRHFVSGGDVRQSTISSTVPFTWTTNDKFWFKFSVPIADLSSGAMLSTTETMFQTHKASAYITGNQTITNGVETKVAIDASRFDQGDLLDATNNEFVVKKKGIYAISAYCRFASSFTATDVQLQLEINGSFDRFLERKNVSGVADALQGFAVVELNAGDIVDFEVFQNSGANHALSGAATESERSEFSIFELPDFSVFSVYNETEVLETNNSTFTVLGGTVDQFQDLDTLELTPGEWDISGIVSYDETGSAGTQTLSCLIGDTAGNSTSGAPYGKNYIGVRYLGASGDRRTLTISPYKEVITETSTRYIKAKGTGNHANLTVAYSFRARKVK